MSEYRTVLGRIERRVPMPEPAMERLLRRRDRKRRNARIAAAAVGLIVAVVGIGWGLVALRFGGEPVRPGSGGSVMRGPAGDGGWLGIVLPTVAVWIALAVLGLTGLAIVRLRERPARAFAKGTTSGVRPAPGHGPVVATGTAHGKGGSEMDSREKMGIRIPQTEVRVDGRVRRLNRWLAVAVVVLVAAVVALGAALIAQSGEEPPPEPLGLASTEVVQAIDATIAALNGADTAALAATYADDAVVIDLVADMEFEGADEIAEWYTTDWPGGWNLEPASEVIQLGNVAALAFTSRQGDGFTLVQFNRNMEIFRQWVIGAEVEFPDIP